LVIVAGALSVGVMGRRHGCSLVGASWFGYTPLTHSKIETPSGRAACKVSIFRR
jgi:hypothetical protein